MRASGHKPSKSNPKQFTSKPPCKEIPQSLQRVGALVALLLTLLLTPAMAQSREMAAVVLDGRPIFQISSYEPFTAQARADWINLHLQAVAESQNPPEIEIEERNQSPIVAINGRYLLTVTQSDVVLGNTPKEQAQIWAEQIRNAVQQAQRERSTQFLWRALLLLASAVLLAIAIHWGLGRLWQRFLRGDEQRSHSLSLNLRLLLARIILWLTLALYALDLLPLTRQWSYRLAKGQITSLTFPLLFILCSLIAGQYTPPLARLILQKIFPRQGTNIYQNLIEPIKNLLAISSTLILISFSLVWIQKYQVFYNFFQVFLNLAVVISVAGLISRLFRQFVRAYGIDFIRKLGWEVDELLLVVETVANVLIGFIAVVAFAQSQNVNLVGLLAGLGIGGIAIAFAAQKTLEQLIGTIALYLDRPYIPGEYIRVNFNPMAEDVFARVESIGLRSTKLRTVAKSTLLIVPNSIMASKDIENISRGKKLMVLLYLDFSQSLAEPERALVEQVVKESTDTLFGIDPGSTKITLFQPEDKPGTRARVSFFILGSSEDSIGLRKRLLELANEKISEKLTEQSISFVMQEPTIYVESPVTI